MKTIGIGIAVAVLLAASPAVALDVYTRGINPLLNEPRAEGAVLDVLRAGQKVDMRRCEAGWCIVRVGDLQGWVPEEKLVLRGLTR